MSSGALDIGFVHPPLGTTERFNVMAFPPERYVAALPDDGETQPITLAEIAELGLILFPYQQGPVLHSLIMDSFATAGVEVRIVQEASRALTMLSLASTGMGAALLPASIQRLNFRGVRYAEILSPDFPTLSLAVVTKNSPVSRMVNRVWRLFRR